MHNKNITHDNLPSAVLEILQRVQKIETLVEATPPDTSTTDPEPFIYGISGLAKFLKVSLPTAQKIKNSGRIPFSQAERTIIFRKAEVLAELSNTKKRG